MIGFGRGGTRRNLPLGSNEAGRFLPWVVALMVYVAGLGGIGLIVLEGTVRAAEHSLATTLTLQVPADTSKARMETVLALLRQTRGIVSAKVLEPKEIARLLEPFLGSKVPLDALPVPQLVDLRIDPAGPPDLAVLRPQLASVAPQARLDDHRPWLAGARVAARRVEGILASAIAVTLLLIALSAAFAVRAALVGDRSTVELVHLLGAADSDIARHFAVRSLSLGLLGGAIGAAAAFLTLVALGDAGGVVQPLAPSNAPLNAPVNAIGNAIGSAVGIADWRVWAILTGGVLSAGLIAMASARLTVRRWLAPMA